MLDIQKKSVGGGLNITPNIHSDKEDNIPEVEE